MSWRKAPNRLRGDREGPKPLAAGVFEHSSGARIHAYVYGPWEYTPASMKSGIMLQWSYKEPGKAWQHAQDNVFLCWPLEIIDELHLLLRQGEKAQKAT